MDQLSCEKPKTSVQKGTGETYLIRHPEHSWALFMINEHGDLFLSSDWGYWTFSWRSFGAERFKSFLAVLEDEYFFGKLLINHNQWSRNKARVPARTETAIKALFRSFQEILQQEIQSQP